MQETKKYLSSFERKDSQRKKKAIIENWIWKFFLIVRSVEKKIKRREEKKRYRHTHETQKRKGVG